VDGGYSYAFTTRLGITAEWMAHRHGARRLDGDVLFQSASESLARVDLRWRFGTGLALTRRAACARGSRSVQARRGGLRALLLTGRAVPTHAAEQLYRLPCDADGRWQFTESSAGRCAGLSK
jgi:hypothetical protein